MKTKYRVWCCGELVITCNELDRAIDCANEFARESPTLLELAIMREHSHVDECVFRHLIPKEIWYKEGGCDADVSVDR